MFYSHTLWFIVLLVMFILSLLGSIIVTLSKCCFIFSFDIFSSWFFCLDFSVTLDWISMWFMTLVLLISSIISIYSFFYMSPYYNSFLFLWTTFLFIVSMLIVIVISSLFYSMLGWDGLGIVSFFLIVFYQNSSSITSGLFTLLMNRLGDGFFLVSLAIMSLSLPDYFSSSSALVNSALLPFLLVITFITNSALYPFSSWLPMAMAAPTPISALVHSSTLVTSGLYLMMRFSYIIYSSSFLTNVLISISLFTSFYAGVNTLFEMDLNKLIALSTLSHLGFIGMSFSCGLLTLSFFHLLVHALFKSLLFMCMGDIMINLSHSQDIRFLSSGFHYTPFSAVLMYVSLINLLGMPNMSGFFSNDLVIEAFHYSDSSSLSVLVLYFNVLFTYYYTFQLFYYSFSSNKLSAMFLFHPQGGIHAFLMSLLGVASICFGKFFIDLVCCCTFFMSVPFSFKLLPFAINTIIFSYLLIFIAFPNPSFPLLSYSLSNMLSLTSLLMSVSSYSYYKSSFMLVKDMELGLVNYYLHVSLSSSLSSCLSLLYSFYRFQPLYVVLVSLLIVFI